MGKYVRADGMAKHTPESIETFICTEMGIEPPLRCGPQMLIYLAGHVNGNFMTLEGLVQCIKMNPGIIDLEPMGNNKFIVKRREMLRRCRYEIMAAKKKDPMDLFKDRILKLEEKVQFLMDLHRREMEDDFEEPKYSRRRITI